MQYHEKRPLFSAVQFTGPASVDSLQNVYSFQSYKMEGAHPEDKCSTIVLINGKASGFTLREGDWLICQQLEEGSTQTWAMSDREFKAKYEPVEG